MNKILNYLKPIWEDNNNEPSIRRVLALMFALGVMRMVEHSYVNSCEIDNEALTTLCATMLILLGLITWQNITDIKKINAPGQTNNTENSSSSSEVQG